jgi:hypothetical protein
MGSPVAAHRYQRVGALAVLVNRVFNPEQTMSNINQEFQVEIVRITDGGEIKVAPAFCAAVTEWEREFDTRDIEDEEYDAADAADENGEGEDEDSDFVLDTPEATLYLTAKVNANVLTDFRDLTSSNSNDEYKVRVIYGNDSVGKIVREFDTTCDARMILSEGSKSAESSATDLEVLFAFDVYDESFSY